VPGVGAVEGNGSPEIVRVRVSDPVRDTPALVRALVAGGADVLGVSSAPATLESVYFDVMGAPPPSDGGVI
jgi:hypothetical protein